MHVDIDVEELTWTVLMDGNAAWRMSGLCYAVTVV